MKGCVMRPLKGWGRRGAVDGNDKDGWKRGRWLAMEWGEERDWSSTGGTQFVELTLTYPIGVTASLIGELWILILFSFPNKI